MSSRLVTTTDVTGHTIRVAAPVQRIVSLVPSITESLIALGARKTLVGRTVYCIHPERVVNKIPTFGGTKDPDLDGILKLRPDLVLANREENLAPHVGTLREKGVCVHVSEPKTVTDAMDLVMWLGAFTDTEGSAYRVTAHGLWSAKHLPRPMTKVDSRPRILVPIWREPWMVAGPDTFIAGVLTALGCDVIVPEGSERRYPLVAQEVLSQLNPDAVLLPSEPYSFTSEHVSEITRVCHAAPASACGRIALCQGEDLMWFGTRTPGALQRLSAQLVALFR